MTWFTRRDGATHAEHLSNIGQSPQWWIVVNLSGISHTAHLTNPVSQGKSPQPKLTPRGGIVDRFPRRVVGLFVEE